MTSIWNAGALADEPGQIIVLNGTSSAGKTSIARALQEILPAPYLHVAFDTFMHMLPARIHEYPDAPAIFHRTVTGMHHAVRALSDTGSNVVLDHVLRCPSHPDSRDWMEELVAVLPAERTFLVAVRCALEELERRERVRWESDRRFIGLARSQYEQVHLGNVYDFEVDTTSRTTEESARLIADAHGRCQPSAVARMQEAHP